MLNTIRFGFIALADQDALHSEAGTPRSWSRKEKEPHSNTDR